MQPCRDRKPVDLGQPVVRGDAVARQHQVAGGIEDYQHHRMDLVVVLAQVQVPVRGVVEVEEGLDRNLQGQDGVDVEVDREPDSQGSATEVEVDHCQEGSLGCALQVGKNRQQFGLHHQQQT